MMQWDPVQQGAIEKAAEKHGVSVQDAKALVEGYLKSNMRHVRAYEPVVVVNFGLFHLDPRKTLGRVMAMFRKYRAGGIPKEEFEAKFPVWWDLHNKARAHMPRKGKKYRYNMMRYGSNWGALKQTKHEQG